MTYTREQIEEILRAAFNDAVAEAIQQAGNVEAIFDEVGRLSDFAGDFAARLSLIEPIDIEPTPAPKENANEKRRTYEPVDPYLNPPDDCRICGHSAYAHLPGKFCPS